MIDIYVYIEAYLGKYLPTDKPKLEFKETEIYSLEELHLIDSVSEEDLNKILLVPGASTKFMKVFATIVDKKDIKKGRYNLVQHHLEALNADNTRNC